MDDRVALCLDEATCRNLQLVGLQGEPVDSLEWLAVHTGGDEARRAVKDDAAVAEAWVVSCDDVEPINLAATLKGDRSEVRVMLVTFEPCGSLFSRAHAAGIDEVADLSAFLRRYAAVKHSHADRAAVGLGQAARGEGPAVEPSPQQEAPHQVPRKLLGRMGKGKRPALPAQASQPGLLPEQPADVLVLDPPEFSMPEDSPMPVKRLLGLQAHGKGAEASGSRAFVFTVVSGSGGAGKSSVSALSALIAQRRGLRTLLVDCDLQFGDVAAMVGARNPLRIDEAIGRPDRLRTDLAASTQLAVLAAPTRLEAAEQVAGHLPDLLEQVAGDFDVIVANTGATWAEQHAALLERSSAALFLIDQRVSSIRSCQHALDLCARCGIATGPFQFALNRCTKGAPLTSVDVSCALQGAPVFELKDGGRDVEDYLSGGAAGELLDLRNEFAKSLEHVLDQLLPAAPGAASTQIVKVEGRRSQKRRARHSNRKRGW